MMLVVNKAKPMTALTGVQGSRLVLQVLYFLNQRDLLIINTIKTEKMLGTQKWLDCRG